MTAIAIPNANVVNSAIDGATNAPIHLAILARHLRASLELKHCHDHGHAVLLLFNMQPAGEYLGEGYEREGWVSAVIAQLIQLGMIHEDALTVNGKTIGENCRAATTEDQREIRPASDPIR